MFSRVSPSYEFVLRSLALGLDPKKTAALDETLRRPELNWERVAYFASRYHVSPALFPIWKQQDIADRIPPDFLAYAEALHDLNQIRNEEILSEVDRIARLLNEIGIEPIALKGVAYLLLGVYPNPASRFIGDIDMLVDSSSFPSAVRQLMKHEFCEHEDEPFDPFSHHHRPLSRSAETATVEIHRRLGTRYLDALLPVADVIRNSRPAVREGVRLRLPSPEHLLMHLILRTEAEEGIRAWIWPPLRTLYDFGLCIRAFGAQIDWKKIEQRFHANGCEHIFHLFCLAAEEWIGVERLPGVSPEKFKLRFKEAQILRTYPSLRFLDPWFIVSVMLGARMERIRICLRTPGGLSYLAKRTFSSRRFKILFADVLGGE